MPEGDTIFRAARSLSRALVAKPITGFRSNYPLLTRFNDNTPLTGQLVDQVEPRGKWMLIYFSGGGILATHLLMSGSWHIYRPREPWQKAARHMRIVIENSEYVAVGFNVPVAEMHTPQSLARDRRIPGLDADVLSDSFDPAAAAERFLKYSPAEVGEVLLHQKVLAGVGNVFKSEICFLTGINPFCRVAALGADEINSLVRCAQRLIRANVLEDSGGTTLRGRQRRTTHQSDPGESLWVYGRTGQPCRRCGAPIRRRIQGPDARVTFWCQLCQPMPDRSDVDG